MCLIVMCCLCLSATAFASQSSQVKAMSEKQLLEALVKLDIGLEKYRIGMKLNKKQLKKAEVNPIKNRYQGTIKYKDGDVGVVADSSNHNILALFLENQEAGQEHIKNMVATLMMLFGQPTTMAHEKIVYWAFNEQGLISEEIHKKAKNVDELNILATVKFNSKTRFMEKNEGEDAKNSIYCIVSSPALLERFNEK